MSKVSSLAVIAALAAVGAAQTGRLPDSRQAPRLVLAISIDQMRFDYLTRFAPLYTGGLRRLLDRGAVFENAAYRHSNCETGPGHAVFLSGRDSLHSGIVANEWYDSLLGRVVNVVDDPAVEALGGKGRGASPANFIGFTVGDMLKKRTPGSRVVGVAVKDRAAVLMAGPRADGAYWFEADGGNFVTSSYYVPSAPGWLEAFNRARRPDAYAGQAWTRLLPDEGLYARLAGEDAVPTEADGKDTTFPHAFSAAPPATRFYEQLRRTPFADELTLDFALEAMRAHGLGSDADTDLLAVGFSAMDSIGHAFGPDSQEVMDQLLRLDRTLGRLLDAVEARAGLERTLVVLSSDHGVMPLAERLQAQGLPGRRARPDTFETAVRRALELRLPGKTGLVARFVTPDVYLDLEQVRRQGLKRADVEAAVEEGLLSTGLVARVYTAARLLGDPPAGDPYFDAVRRSFFEPRSPHVIMLPREYVYISSYVGGTGHGTPYEYDRHVPIVFMGPGVKAGRYPAPSEPEDVAPTLGRLLGLDYPLQDARRILSEMLEPVD